ncbi:MAG: glycosyltransferase family 4 protein [Thermoanaerobaculia bacterium]
MQDLPARSSHLREVIEQWRPDLVISLKMQNDGYTVEEALSSLAGSRPTWLHFTWGSDIEFFGKHPEYAPAHLPRIRRVLASCDYLLSDCRRDQRQARELGFRGVSLGACIAPGGFDLSTLETLRAKADAERDVILVKGREGGLVGKGLNSMKALARLAPQLKGYRIRVVMATPEVRVAAEELRALHGLDCEVLPRLAYRDLLLCFGRSRLAIAASDVDGTPGFLIEAMAMGALPIHSDMESVREWIDDGVNGLLFPVDDMAALATCIERGLGDEALLASARERNWALAGERMDRSKIRAMIREMIEKRVMA